MSLVIKAIRSVTNIFSRNYYIVKNILPTTFHIEITMLMNVLPVASHASTCTALI